jgi:hypothetical protein
MTYHASNLSQSSVDRILSALHGDEPFGEDPEQVLQSGSVMISVTEKYVKRTNNIK